MNLFTKNCGLLDLLIKNLKKNEENSLKIFLRYTPEFFERYTPGFPRIFLGDNFWLLPCYGEDHMCIIYLFIS